ncbi:MAG: CofH family radical SAM protein [Fibrobacteria bacterium]|nr:CofH family radical SAM protein [Fibrobacteria bacterium]
MTPDSSRVGFPDSAAETGIFGDVTDIRPLLDKALAGERLTLDDAGVLLSSDDWTSMVKVGHELRNRRHDPAQATWTAFRVINYTNFCDVDCSFCSFKDEIRSSRGYTLTLEQIEAKTVEARDLGCDAIFFQGGVNPDLPLAYYTEAFQIIAHRHGMHVRALSPVELWRLAEKEGISLETLLEVLKQAGLGSVPGAGAEILTERMREVLSPKKLTAAQWCETMGACHRAGLPGSCNIVFGSTETVEDVAAHLGYLRDQQDRTGGFLSFVPWVFQPQTKNFPIRHVMSWEYLRMVAVARMFLDNIDNIEVSIMVMGRELAELGLRAGANDISSIVIEENVLASRGLKTMRAAERFLSEAGFQPRRRTLGYELL